MPTGHADKTMLQTRQNDADQPNAEVAAYALTGAVPAAGMQAALLSANGEAQNNDYSSNPWMRMARNDRPEQDPPFQLIVATGNGGGWVPLKARFAPA